MKEIKFNRNYKKLYNQKKAVLVERLVVYPEELSQEFISFDTDGKYKLNMKQCYLVLYFIGNKKIPFTTLRKYNEENVKKYFNSIGEVFKITVEEEAKKGKLVPWSTGNGCWVPMEERDVK